MKNIGKIMFLFLAVLLVPLSVSAASLVIAGSTSNQDGSQVTLPFWLVNEDTNITGYMVAFEYNPAEVQPISVDMRGSVPFASISEKLDLQGIQPDLHKIYFSRVLLNNSFATDSGGILGEMTFKVLTGNDSVLKAVYANMGVYDVQGNYIPMEYNVTLHGIKTPEPVPDCVPQWVLQPYGSCVDFKQTAYYLDNHSCGMTPPEPLTKSCQMVGNIVPSLAQVNLSSSKSFLVSVNKPTDTNGISTSAIQVKDVGEHDNQIQMTLSSSGQQVVTIYTGGIGKPYRVYLDGNALDFSSDAINTITFMTHFSDHVVVLDYNQPPAPETPPTPSGGSGGSGGSGHSSGGGSSCTGFQSMWNRDIQKCIKVNVCDVDSYYAKGYSRVNTCPEISTTTTTNPSGMAGGGGAYEMSTTTTLPEVQVLPTQVDHRLRNALYFLGGVIVLAAIALGVSRHKQKKQKQAE